MVLLLSPLEVPVEAASQTLSRGAFLVSGAPV